MPIIPDEARTFGMDSWFPSLKIYNRNGQLYTAVDAELMLAYKESEIGQILHEGINEAGSTASFTAVGTSYSTHNEPMIPLYIFYSMFGFQRTGDGFWAAADQMARGFVLGATAGRTTLTGEGLQHADGHSLLLASTNPAVVTYDPAFAYEIAYIVESGLARMFGENPENVYFYMTIYNEPYVQPRRTGGLRRRGAAARHLPLPAPRPRSAPTSRRSWRRASRCRRRCGPPTCWPSEWDVAADVWSVTSWGELNRDGVAIEKELLRHPDRPARVPYVTQGRSATPPARSSRSRTGCGPCPSRSGRGCPTPTSRWAPTASGSPTPGPRRGATSTPTPSRWWWRCWRRWPATARSTRRWRSKRPSKYQIDDVLAAPEQTL